MTKSESERVEHLEFLVAHLQKQYDDLNKVVYAQQRTIELLRNRLSHLDQNYQSLLESDRVLRSLADDRPPHY